MDYLEIEHEVRGTSAISTNSRTPCFTERGVSSSYLPTFRYELILH